jgi:D-3-phosphoglycerate dehydrogenase
MSEMLKGVKVLLGPSSFGDLDKTPIEKLRAAGCEIILNPYKRKLTRAELLDLLKHDVSGLVAGLEMLDREVLEKTNLKVISRCGSGLSNVDQVAAAKLGIEIRSTPNGPTLAVAELTVGAMLSMLRMIPQLNGDLHSGKWNKQVGRQLSGMTVAIIGFGRIGRQVSALLKSFNVKILAVDPQVAFSISMDKALTEADIITLHCSGEDVVLGEQEFLKMKEGVFILNAARGVNMDEDALMKALDSGKVAGAWIDAFCKEPYDGRLKDYAQVILTPHVASYTLEGRRVMELETVDNLIEAFEKVRNGQK